MADVDTDTDSEELRLAGTSDKHSSEAVLTANGVTERVKIVQGTHASGVQPFRLSVDLTRACLVTVMVGVGYLL